MVPWAVRKRLTWTPPIGRVRSARLGWPTSPEVSALRARYDTALWGRIVRPGELDECLYVLALLDVVVPAGTVGPGLDVGSKSWSYLAAQRSALPGRWDGVELDAHRRIGAGQTRASIARWRCAQAPGARFIAGSVIDLDERYGLVTWFLPFVRPEPHRRWGLPRSLFDPPALLAHVWSLVAPGGTLIVTNQGDAEADAQQVLFDHLGIAADRLGPVADQLSPFTNSRPTWRARRSDQPSLS